MKTPRHFTGDNKKNPPRKKPSKKKPPFRSSHPHPSRADISVSIIGHNEGRHLSQLLPTLGWAKEIIYVDCESADDSIQLARKYGCRVYTRKNNPNFNVNKQFGIDQAKGDWILYLDPDERLTDAGVEELRKNSQGGHGYHAFKMDRRNYMLGRFLRHGDVYPDTQLRFFKKGSAHFSQKHVHEFLQVEGKVGKLQEDMVHYAYLSVRQMLLKFDWYTSFEAEHLFRKGVRPSWGNAILFLILKPLHLFFLKFFLKRGWKDGYPGLIFAFMSALHFPIRYFKLWELVRGEIFPERNGSPVSDGEVIGEKTALRG